MDTYGGDRGINIQLFEICLKSPQLRVGQQEAFPTIEEKAANYLYKVNAIHAVTDGAKRTGLAFCLHFLHLNGYTLDCEEDEVFELLLGIAKQEKNYDDALKFVKEKIKKN